MACRRGSCAGWPPVICKDRPGQLAIFGGPPAFAEPAHVGRPNLGCRARFLQRVEELLDRRWLTNNGPLVREFEERVAGLLAVRHCVALNNGTTALELAIRAMGLEGQVIVPAMTFVATVNALRWSGLAPIFCDIDPATHNLDPKCVEELITPHTSAILAVHLWGRPCEVEALAEIALRHRLTLLYDAAHAFACTRRGRMVGGFGDAEAFSFHATKLLHTLEGGAITTDDDGLAARLRLMRNHGLTPEGDVARLGINGKMNEIAAAMGLSLLEQLDVLIAANQRNYLAYQAELRDLAGVGLLGYEPGEKHNFQYVVVEIDEPAARIGRDRLMQILRAENVLARRYYYPGCHRVEPYRDGRPQTSRALPATEQVLERVLCLPSGETIDPSAVRAICSIIRTVVENGSEVRRRLEAPRGA
jgi:dTDP-4-amino-4,6-dideoxygalactose transaminase